MTWAVLMTPLPRKKPAAATPPSRLALSLTTRAFEFTVKGAWPSPTRKFSAVPRPELATVSIGARLVPVQGQGSPYSGRRGRRCRTPPRPVAPPGWSTGCGSSCVSKWTDAACQESFIAGGLDWAMN